jgi:hypothetical protein
MAAPESNLSSSYNLEVEHLFLLIRSLMKHGQSADRPVIDVLSAVSERLMIRWVDLPIGNLITIL